MRYWILLFILVTCGCLRPQLSQDQSMQPIMIKESLTRVTILDHSGLSETITNSERLKELRQRNFLSPQPYRKVTRLYAHNHEGSSRSIITSYCENGQIRQYLECLNGRACGLYQEWHPNGQVKLLARILAGQADIEEKAFPTWSFDGICKAWNEQGILIATFMYQHGVLNGRSETFYDTGERKCITLYENGLKEGEEITYSVQGRFLQSVVYHLGLRQGIAAGAYEDGSEAWKEEFDEDHLITATYRLSSGQVISSVANGEGIRSVFEEAHLISQEEIHRGIPSGWITLFEYDGSIERKYEIQDGMKHGTEIRYYPLSKAETRVAAQIARLSIDWSHGMIHGIVKTWYPNGVLESQREMSQNMKQGVTMAWYPDGGIMLVEEYNDDKLVRGQYHRPRATDIVSTVENGNGIATLFDPSGSITEKIHYLEGKPQVEG